MLAKITECLGTMTKNEKQGTVFSAKLNREVISFSAMWDIATEIIGEQIHKTIHKKEKRLETLFSFIQRLLFYKIKHCQFS